MCWCVMMTFGYMARMQFRYILRYCIALYQLLTNSICNKNVPQKIHMSKHKFFHLTLKILPISQYIQVLSGNSILSLLTHPHIHILPVSIKISQINLNLHSYSP